MAAAPVQLRPYAYARISSNSTYDIVLADGIREIRVARIKVDSVFFGNVSARLSTDGSTVAFRVSGDRKGGSSLYSVDTSTAKYVQVTSASNTSQGIGSYAWSPAGNTMAFVLMSPALDPDKVDEGYGTIYVYSVGFKAMKLAGSH